MKTILILIFLSLFICSNCYSSTKYNTPWIENFSTLHSLINENFKIVGTTIAVLPLGSGMIEILYLQKGKDLYRCATIEQEKSEGHECEKMIRPSDK